MAISILFGMLFITPCIVFEVHGGRKTIEAETPESVSNTKNEHNNVSSISASDHNTGDVLRNPAYLSFASFPPMRGSLTKYISQHGVSSSDEADWSFEGSKNSIKLKPLPSQQNLKMNSFQCCVKNECFELKSGQICGGSGKSLQTNNRKNQQQPILNYQSFKKLTPKLQASDEDSISTDSGDESSGSESYEPPSGPFEYKGVTKDEGDIIRNIVLDRTNYHRKNHNLPELKLNDDLNNNAQQWANDLIDSQIQRINVNEYGINIFQEKVIGNVGKTAVDQFYDEIAYYRPNDSESKISENSQIRHLTQLLWKESKFLGVGVSKSENGQYTIFCTFNPKGNIFSLYKKNLPKITKKQVDAGKKRVQEKERNRKKKIGQSPMYNVKKRTSINM